MTKTAKRKPTIEQVKSLLRADGISEDVLKLWDGEVSGPDSMALPDGDDCMRIANYIGWTDIADANREYMSMTTPGDVKTFLDALDGSDATFLLNTPGGSVFGGIEISNLIMGYPGKTTAIVTGVAASCGSLVLAACDEALMLEASMAMIHGPHTFGMGGAADFRDLADRLDKEAITAGTIYKRRMDDEAVDGMLASGDHYFTSAEAVESGLADGLYEDPEGDDDDAGDDAQINTNDKMTAEARAELARRENDRLSFLATGMLN